MRWRAFFDFFDFLIFFLIFPIFSFVCVCVCVCLLGLLPAGHFDDVSVRRGLLFLFGDVEDLLDGNEHATERERERERPRWFLRPLVGGSVLIKRSRRRRRHRRRPESILGRPRRRRPFIAARSSYGVVAAPASGYRVFYRVLLRLGPMGASPMSLS